MHGAFSEDSVRNCEDGEIIFREGDQGREMYIVQSGKVKISKNTKDGTIELATLERGDFLGEMSLLESLPRSATAQAVGNTKLYAIQPGGFLLKIRRDPTFAFELMQALSQRIRNTNEQLLESLKSGTITESKIREMLDKS